MNICAFDEINTSH